LPLGDNGKFEWRAVSVRERQNVLDEIKKKQQLNEIIGVVVTYKDSLIGGELLILPSKSQISFSISINRKKLENRITDFQWYEDRILPWLRTFKSDIDSVYLCQSDSGGNIEFEKKILGTALN
jgi:hypothetical protein